MSQKVGKDLLLAFLYAEGKGRQCNEAICGRTRLEKMMFIFEKELSKGFFKDEDVVLPEFIPYLYGPYSMEVLDDLNFFISIEFIKATETSIKMENETSEIQNWVEMDNDDLWDEVNGAEITEQYEKSYMLTEKGENYTRETIWPQLTDNQKSVIIRLKKQINSMLLDDLLSYVYKKYPEYAKESLIKDKYLDE